jgi:hypothetical protein
MRDVDDQGGAEGRRSRRGPRKGYWWAGGLVLAVVAGVGLMRHGGSVRPVQVTAAGNQMVTPPTAAGETPTTGSSTSTLNVVTTTTPTPSTTSTTRPPSSTPTSTTTSKPTTTTTATTVTVTPQAFAGQGPALPAITTLSNYASVDHYGDSHYLPLFIGARDEDGWISQFLIDWGDSSAPVTLAYNPFPCKAMPPSGWPADNYVSIPSNTLNPEVGLDGKPAPSTEHFYSTPGTYTVTVIVRSTACDGSQPQEGTRSMTWPVVG